MEIRIENRGFAMTPALDALVRRRLRFALATRGEYIERIDVHLSDAGGIDDRCDRRCLLRVALPGHADVVIENVEPDLHLAIHRAADRAGWTVARQLDRRRRRVRARMLPPGNAPAREPHGRQTF